MYNIKRSLAELCNGSTTDSDSVCWGSNPYSAASKTDHVFSWSVFLSGLYNVKILHKLGKSTEFFKYKMIK